MTDGWVRPDLLEPQNPGVVSVLPHAPRTRRQALLHANPYEALKHQGALPPKKKHPGWHGAHNYKQMAVDPDHRRHPRHHGQPDAGPVAVQPAAATDRDPVGNFFSGIFGQQQPTVTAPVAQPQNFRAGRQVQAPVAAEREPEPEHIKYRHGKPVPVAHSRKSPQSYEVSQDIDAPGTATATLNMSKVAAYAASRQRHHQDTTGNCFHGVQALLAAGGVHLDTTGMPRHKDRETGLPTVFADQADKPLRAAGFANVGKMPLDEVPVGSVVVWGSAGALMADGEPEHRAGHIMMRVASKPNGEKSWVSDNTQNYENPFGRDNYTVYSPATVAYNPAPALQNKEQHGQRIHRHHRIPGHDA